MVEFEDGTVLAQLGVTDMRMPIQYALSHPERWPAAIPGIEVSRYPEASWRYDVSPEGHMSLAFSRELASPYGANVKSLPLAFRSN